MVSKRILLLAGLVWLADAVSKWWAVVRLTDHPMMVIPNFFYVIFAKNPGGSYGLGHEYMELCLTMPATLVFVIYLSLTVAEKKKGFHPTPLMQIGFASLTGGTIANWTERVLYGHVTDFCYLTWMNCIWNLADVFISAGFALIVIEVYRLARQKRLGLQRVAPIDGSGAV